MDLLPPAASHLSIVLSTLKPLAWSYYLADYPNCTFVESLLNIIQHGNIGFGGDCVHHQTSSNLWSATEHFNAINTDITMQVAKG